MDSKAARYPARTLPAAVRAPMAVTSPLAVILPAAVKAPISLICMFIAMDSVMDASLMFHKPYSTNEEFCGMDYTLRVTIPFDNIRLARPHQTCQPSFSCQLACPGACETALMLHSDNVENGVFDHS